MTEEYEVYYPQYIISGAPSNWTKSITYSLEHAMEVIKSLDRSQRNYAKIFEKKEVNWRDYA